MTVKEQLLEWFLQHKGIEISGETLAGKLNVSRNAVWKAIVSLKEEGYQITSVNHKGYCFEPDNDYLSANIIYKYLNPNLPINIQIEKCVSSTNDLVKDAALKGAEEGFLLLAEKQTAGKGRLGRTFCSPSGTGIYMSMLLRPKLSVEDSLYITTAAAVAVYEAIKLVTGIETSIKWVNDIFLNDKKICGILTEGAFDMESKGLSYAVLGIGINVGTSSDLFDEEVKKVADSLFHEEYDSDIRNQLVAAVWNRFFYYYENLMDKEFLNTYKEKSILIGKEVTYQKEQKNITATVLDIDECVRLVVQSNDGKIEKLMSGEVSVRLKH